LDVGRAISILESTVPKGRVPGPRAGYHIGHSVMAVLHLSELKRVSRWGLSRLLGVSEGTVKTLIAYMQLAHIVATSSAGTSLSGFGFEVASALREVVASWREVKLFYLVTDAHSVAFRLMPANLKPLNPLALRDLVVKYGGTGSTLLTFSDGKFSIPFVSDDLASSSREDVEELKKLSPGDGDVLVVVSSRSVASAETSFAAALVNLLR
jgi:hypothetical protein